MKSCIIDSCNNKYYSKGFCKVHYDKNRRHGDPLFEEALRKNSPCSIEGCKKPFFSNDLCQMHNARLQRHGNPRFVNPKCNRDGNYKARARIKSAEWKKAHAELNSSFNQARKTRMRKSSKQERQVIKQFYLDCPEGFVVDHILPINHSAVSGLHCICNLQYLPKSDNSHKSNKFDGTYENESWRKDSLNP